MDWYFLFIRTKYFLWIHAKRTHTKKPKSDFWNTKINLSQKYIIDNFSIMLKYDYLYSFGLFLMNFFLVVLV